MRGPPSPSPLVTNSGTTTPRVHQRLSPQPLHRVSQHPVVGPQSPHARQKVTYASSPGAMRTAVSPSDSAAASAASACAAAYSPTSSKRSRGSSPSPAPMPMKTQTLHPRGCDDSDKDLQLPLQQTHSMPLSASGIGMASIISCPPTRDHSFGSVFLQPASPLFSPLLSDPQRLLFMSHSAPGTPQGSPQLGSGTFIFPPPSPFANAAAFANAASLLAGRPPFAFGLGAQPPPHAAAASAAAASGGAGAFDGTNAHAPHAASLPLQPGASLSISPQRPLLWTGAPQHPFAAYAQLFSDAFAARPSARHTQQHQPAHGSAAASGRQHESAAAPGRSPSRSQETCILGAGGGAFLTCSRSSSSPPLAVPAFSQAQAQQQQQQKRPSDTDSASSLDAPPVKTHPFADLTGAAGGVHGVGAVGGEREGAAEAEVEAAEAESDEQQQQQQLMAAALSSGDPNAIAALRSHLCNTCGRVFSRSDMLTRHLRLHSGTSVLCTHALHLYCTVLF